MAALDTFLRIMAWSAARPTRWVRRARGWLRALLVRERTEQVHTVVVNITADTSQFEAAMERLQGDLRRLA